MTDKATRLLVREIAASRRELSVVEGCLTEAFKRLNALEASRRNGNSPMRRDTSLETKQQLYEQGRRV